MARSRSAHRLDLDAALGLRLPDLVRPGLDVLFCGINPGRTSAALGHHFARPGNRFWPVLHRAGFTPEQLDPKEDGQLLGLGYGLTNLVARTTARADELSVDELRAGARRLERELVALAPRILAVLGVGAYRQAFGAPGAKVGKQGVALGHTEVWVLPNPSGLNAHYPMSALVAAYRQLYEEAGAPCPPIPIAARAR